MMTTAEMAVESETAPGKPIYRRIPWAWVLCWVLLPNLAIIAMWPIGGPNMTAPIMVAGLIALFVSQWRSFAVRAVGVFVIFALVLATYTTKSFNINLLNVVFVFDYVSELDPLRSPEYLVAGVLLVVSLVVTIYFASRTRRFQSRDQYLLALACIAVLVNVDAMATAGTQGGYKASAPAGTPIDGAIIQAGISPSSVTAKNLVVVIVESWGVPTDPRAKAVDARIFNPDRWSTRYIVSQGKARYYGSTTNAELREWCGVWADHYSFDFDDNYCLPKQFRRAGFETLAFHSFVPQFFDRGEWYPKLGFDHVQFGPELRDRGAAFCDGVFPGACDRDIPELIGESMRSSGSDRKLVYWLTLNAHLPISSDPDLGTESCNLGPQNWREDYPMLCRSYLVLGQTADAITQEIMDEQFPESDILIVGDHMPPFFPRAIRNQFDTGHVPWIFLRNRKAAARGKETTLALAASENEAHVP